MSIRALALCWSLLLAAGFVAAAEPPPRLDLAGDPLPDKALVRLGTTRFRHGSGIASIAYSPDGKSIASIGNDAIRLWNASDGRLKHAWPKTFSGSHLVAFSRDGRVIHVVGHPVNKPEEGAGLPQVRGLGADLLGIRAAAVSSDGRLIAIASLRDVSLFDGIEGKYLRRTKERGLDTEAIAFSPDGKTLATGDYDGTVRLLDVATGEERRKFKLGGQVEALVYAPDGRQLATASKRGHVNSRIELIDLETGHKTRDFVRNGVRALTISPDGQFLAAGGFGKSIQIVSLDDSAKQVQFEAHSNIVEAICFSPDSQLLASAGVDSTIRIWNARTGALQCDDSGHSAPIRSLTFMSKADRLATGSDDGTLRFWDTNSGRNVRSIRAPQSVRALALVDENRLGVISELPRVVDLLQVKEVIPFMPVLDSSFLGESFSANGQFVIGKYNSTVGVFNAGSAKLVGLRDQRLKLDDWQFAVSSDGRLAASFCVKDPASEKAQIHVWDVATGTTVQVWTAAINVQTELSLTFVDNGRLLATVGEVGRLRVWNPTTGKQLAYWSTPVDEPITAVTSDVGGHAIAVGCSSGSIVIWERRTGLVRHQFHGHRGRVRTLQFSPDGRLLASGSDDTTALIWPIAHVAAGEALTVADCKRLWDDLVSGDGGVAERAIWRFASGGAVVIDFLRQAMPPAAAVDPARVARLIRELNDAQFNVRQKAEQELSELADGAKASLQAALESKISAEQRERISALLDRLNETPQGDALRDIRAIEALERHGSPEARKLLESIASGAPGRLRTEEAKNTLARMNSHKQ